jgi:hypothetical protein
MQKMTLLQRVALRKKAETLHEVCGDTALALVVEDMSLMPAFDSGVDARAIASADADEDNETLLQKIQSLIDELQEIETFLSSSEGMSARKEDINKRDNDLTMRMKVRPRNLFSLLFPLELNMLGTGSCGFPDFQDLSSRILRFSGTLFYN